VNGVTVSVEGEEPSGLASMLADLLRGNVAADPSRARLLRECVTTLEAADAGVVATIRLSPGHAVVADGAASRAHLRVRTSGEGLLALAAAPLRFGFPDPFTRDGRGVLRDIVRGRLRIGGLVSHPIRAARLTKLLSVR
jgi:hypothetical protein